MSDKASYMNGEIVTLDGGQWLNKSRFKDKCCRFAHPTLKGEISLDVWTVPFIIVVLVICIISFIAVKKWNKVTVVVDGQDDQISGPIEEHPFTLNPIIWIVLVAVFSWNCHFYYAASS